MNGIEAKLQPDIVEATDADPLASEWVRYLASVAMTGIVTVVAIGVESRVNIPNLSLLFVVPVIVAGVGLGLGPSLCSAVLGALAFNFFLTEPRYSLAVDDPANIWAIALLFVVGVITSGVAFTSRRRANEAALLRKQGAVLQGYGRDVVAADDVDAITAITPRALAALFSVPAVILLVDDGTVVSVKGTNVELQEAELAAARSSLASASILRGGVYPHVTSRFDFWPVRTAGSRNAVIGLAFDPDERPQSPDAPVQIVASVLALALDRRHVREKALSR